VLTVTLHSSLRAPLVVRGNPVDGLQAVDRKEATWLVAPQLFVVPTLQNSKELTITYSEKE